MGRKKNSLVPVDAPTGVSLVAEAPKNTRKETVKAAREREQNLRVRASCAAGLGPTIQSEIYQISVRLARELIANSIQPGDVRWPVYEQLIKSTCSISSNLCEGIGRATYADCLKFIRISRASAYEAVAQADILNKVELREELIRVSQLIDDTLIEILDDVLSRGLVLDESV